MKMLRPAQCLGLLLLAGLSASPGAAETEDLLDGLGLPDGRYWAARNGVPVPIDQLAPMPGSGNEQTTGEVLLLREESGRLEPVGWFLMPPATTAAPTPTAQQLFLDGQGPTLDLRLSGSWTRADDGTIRAAPDVRLLANLQDPSGLSGWRMTDTHPQSISGRQWAAGPHQITATATDQLGHHSESEPLTFFIDHQGPDISWQLTSETVGVGRGNQQTDEDNAIYAPPVDLQLSAVDPAGVFDLAVDAGDGWVSVDPDQVIQVTASTARLRATDQLGNVSETIARWRYDQQAPLITVSVPGRGAVTGDQIMLPVGGAIEIQVADNGVGVEQASYRYNRRSSRPMPRRLRFVDRGWYQLELKARDHLGNERVARYEVRTAPRAYRPRRPQTHREFPQ